jgi:hypothetical protein
MIDYFNRFLVESANLCEQNNGQGLRTLQLYANTVFPTAQGVLQRKYKIAL